MPTTVDKTWSADQAKNLQRMLNHYGFTDDNGNVLAVDGAAGPKTQQALANMNRYQQHLTKPDASTAAWQEQLNDWGFKDASGAPLKVDGVYGPKTDAVTKNFENSFFDGFTGGTDPKKTVQTKIFPTMPKASDAQIKAAVTPNDYNTTGAEWQQSHAIGKSALADPLASDAQKIAQSLQNQKNTYAAQTTTAPYQLDTTQFKNTQEQMKPYTANMNLGLQKALNLGVNAQKNTGLKMKDTGYRKTGTLTNILRTQRG